MMMIVVDVVVVVSGEALPLSLRGSCCVVSFVAVVLLSIVASELSDLAAAM